MRRDPNFLSNVWFSEEAYFLWSGHVNSKNNVIWGSSSSVEVLERLLHSQKCTAWVAISKSSIIGPFWFKDEGKLVTVTTERDLKVIHKFWVALARKRHIERAVQWFQQDGALPHTYNRLIKWLQQKFSDWFISRRTDVERAPHSPDLNTPDFYLWGYWKDVVYQGRPQAIDDLKNAIATNIKAIPVQECSWVIDFTRRIHLCLLQQGSHLEHVLWTIFWNH